MCESSPTVGDSVERDLSLTRRLRHGAIWTMSGRGMGMVIVFAIHMLLARSLSVDRFGAFLIVLSMAVLFGTSAAFGFNVLLCRYLAEAFAVHDNLGAKNAAQAVVRVATVTVVGLSMVGGWLISCFASDWFNLPFIRELGLPIAIWIATLALAQIVAAGLRGLHRLSEASLIDGASGGLAANTLALIALLAIGSSHPLNLNVVVWTTALSLAITVGIGVVCLIRAWPSQKDSRDSHTTEDVTCLRVFAEALPIVGSQVLSYGLTQLDIWIVGMVFSQADLAIYAVARRTSVLVAFPLNQLSLVISASICELRAQSDFARLRSAVKLVAGWSWLLSSLVFVIIIAVGGTLLPLMFGPAFHDGTTTLIILSTGQLVFVLTGPCGPMLMMTGRQHIVLASMGISTLQYVLVAWLSRFGLEGIATVSALYLVTYNGLQWLAVRLLFGFGTQPSSISWIPGIRRVTSLARGLRRTFAHPPTIRFPHLGHGSFPLRLIVPSTLPSGLAAGQVEHPCGSLNTCDAVPRTASQPSVRESSIARRPCESRDPTA